MATKTNKDIASKKAGVVGWVLLGVVALALIVASLFAMRWVAGINPDTEPRAAETVE